MAVTADWVGFKIRRKSGRFAVFWAGATVCVRNLGFHDCEPTPGTQAEMRGVGVGGTHLAFEGLWLGAGPEAGPQGQRLLRKKSQVQELTGGTKSKQLQKASCLYLGAIIRDEKHTC